MSPLCPRVNFSALIPSAPLGIALSGQLQTESGERMSGEAVGQPAIDRLR